MSYLESTSHGFWLLHFTMDNFTSFFLSSADIFQKLALKFQTFSIQIRWDILYILMFANVINMCQNFANTRKASLMLQFSILRLCLLVANFIACCNTADNIFKEFELMSGPTKFWA